MELHCQGELREAIAGLTFALSGGLIRSEASGRGIPVTRRCRRSWIITDGQQNSVVLVEHETGLEILALAGSIASLIALVPVISSGWNRLRDQFFRHHMDRGFGAVVEVRRFNEMNILTEQQAPSLEVYVVGATLNDYARMKQRMEALELEVASLRQKLAANVSTRRARSKPKKAVVRK